MTNSTFLDLMNIFHILRDEDYEYAIKILKEKAKECEIKLYGDKIQYTPLFARLKPYIEKKVLHQGEVPLEICDRFYQLYDELERFKTKKNYLCINKLINFIVSPMNHYNSFIEKIVKVIQYADEIIREKHPELYSYIFEDIIPFIITDYDIYCSIFQTSSDLDQFQLKIHDNIMLDQWKDFIIRSHNKESDQYKQIVSCLTDVLGFPTGEYLENYSNTVAQSPDDEQNMLKLLIQANMNPDTFYNAPKKILGYPIKRIYTIEGIENRMKKFYKKKQTYTHKIPENDICSLRVEYEDSLTTIWLTKKNSEYVTPWLFFKKDDNVYQLFCVIGSPYIFGLSVTNENEQVLVIQKDEQEYLFTYNELNVNNILE